MRGFIPAKNRKTREQRRRFRAALPVLGILLVLSAWQHLGSAGEAPVLTQIVNWFRGNLYLNVLHTQAPVLAAADRTEKGKTALLPYLAEKMMDILPVYSYAGSYGDYAVLAESSQDEITFSETEEETGRGIEKEVKEQPAVQEQTLAQEEPKAQDASQQTSAHTTPAVTFPMEKLADFDYLIHNFYQVDQTTTITSAQLSASAMLQKDMKLKAANDKPQILIYHTHSQESYADSDQTSATSVVGVGEYLARLLRERYGWNVLHDTGTYDVPSRDKAYGVAAPVLQRILAENPSIEIIIDLHRDAVREDMHLVSEQNGNQTAKIMFFNGLSRTTKNGEIASLPNPNLADNLAFSFQMKLMAEQYYPGLTRANYLKAYRYNLQYRPKSLLVEVGAQTNTVAEAMNAMEPLADLLHRVLE